MLGKHLCPTGCGVMTGGSRLMSEGPGGRGWARPSAGRHCLSWLGSGAGYGQTLGGRGHLRPKGEAGEEGVVGLRGWGTWQR